MADVTLIYNSALSSIGTKQRVTLPTERSVEAEECTLWYAQVRDKVLAAAHWTSASAAQRLALQVERDTAVDWVVTDPPPGWLFAYSLPNDMVIPRYLTDYGRFTLGSASTGEKQLYTNTENAILIYTKRIESVDAWDIDLRMAIIFTLGAHVCMKLTGKHERLKIALEQANNLIMGARINDANAQEMQFDTVAPWHAARGVNALSDFRYIFPYGPLVNVEGGF